MILLPQGKEKEGFWGYWSLSDKEEKEVVRKAQARAEADLKEQMKRPLNIQPGRSLNFGERIVIKIKRRFKRL